MFSVEDKAVIVVEICHSVDAVMASQTVFSKMDLVFRHEIWVINPMTVCAEIHNKIDLYAIFGCMTISTSEQITRIILLMADQAEARL